MLVDRGGSCSVHWPHPWSHFAPTAQALELANLHVWRIARLSLMAYVFLTVGTTSFAALVDDACSEAFVRAARTQGCGNIIMQVGRQPIASIPAVLRSAMLEAGCETDKHAEARVRLYDCDVTVFRFKPSIAPVLEAAEIVVSHAGAGSILESVRAGRRLLVVVNPALMDDHQTELARAMQAGGHLEYTRPGKGSVASALSTLAASFVPLPPAAPACDAIAAVIKAEMGVVA